MFKKKTKLTPEEIKEIPPPFQTMQEIGTKPIKLLPPEKPQEPKKEPTIISTNENEPKLNKKQRKILDEIGDKYNEALQKVKERTLEDRANQYKPQLIKGILELNEIFNIEDEKTGKPITKKDLEQTTIQELIEILEEALKLLEKKV